MTVPLRVLGVASLFVACVFACAPARADEATEARLRALEKALRLQQEEIQRLRTELARPAPPPPPVAPAPPAAAAPACAPTGAPLPPPPAPTASSVVGTTSYAAGPYAAGPYAAGPMGRPGPVSARPLHTVNSGVRVGGYGTLEYLAPSDANSTFDLHRLVLLFDASVTKCTDFRAEIEWEHGGVSDELEGEIVVEQAEFLFRISDAFRPKVGALLVPFGRYNLTHDDPLNDFTRRPLTGVFLMPTGWGLPGIGVEGALPVGCHVLTYDAVLNNGYKDDFRADEGVRNARQIWQADENEGKQAWARVAMAWHVPCLDRLETGVSATYAKYDVEDRNDLLGWAVDGLVRWGPFEAKGEYLAYDYERDAFDPADAIERQNGLWLEAAYHVMPCFLRGCRTCLVEDTSHFTLAVRYMTEDLDDHVTGATFEDDLEVWGVALNYRITERSVVRVDYSWYEAEIARDRQEFTFSFSTYF